MTDLEQSIHRRFKADDSALREKREELRRLFGIVMTRESLCRINIQGRARADESIGGIRVEKRYLLVWQACKRHVNIWSQSRRRKRRTLGERACHDSSYKLDECEASVLWDDECWSGDTVVLGYLGGMSSVDDLACSAPTTHSFTIVQKHRVLNHQVISDHRVFPQHDDGKRSITRIWI